MDRQVVHARCPAVSVGSVGPVLDPDFAKPKSSTFTPSRVSTMFRGFAFEAAAQVFPSGEVLYHHLA